MGGINGGKFASQLTKFDIISSSSCHYFSHGPYDSRGCSNGRTGKLTVLKVCADAGIAFLQVRKSYTAYFSKGLSNMQLKLPNRVLFKISGTPRNVQCFFIVTSSELIHFRVQRMGPLKSSQDPLNFVS